MKLMTKLTLGLLGIMTLAGILPAGAEAQDSSELQLAEMYVPVAFLRYHERQCGTPPNEGEPYLPLPVEMVIGNDRVLVRDGANNDEVVATGPTAQELATFGPTTYLDFPGDPRRPGCTYETDEGNRIEAIGLVPSVYANIIFDDENQRLALQYWFFWYFNDWNNTHESDWEGIQLEWDDVAGIDGALANPPDRIGYSQHGNGEMADWGDSKVQLENKTHPLVYPAAGSHATFFSNDTFLAWGERNSGFGCDISSPESVRTPLDVILVPRDIDPEGEFAWLLYPGRWGERQPAAFNGPLGPMFNTRWSDPWVASETWRPFSIVVPGSQLLGPNMTEAFCGLTEAGSRLLVYTMVYPLISLPLLAAVVGALVYFSRRSLPTFKRAVNLYRSHWQLFLGIGLVSIPIGIAFNAIQKFLIGKQPLRFIVNWLDNTGGAELAAVMSVGGLQQLAMVLIISPAIVFAVLKVLRGEPVTIREAYEGASTQIVMIAVTLLIFVLGTSLLLLTAIGLPVAIWLIIRWHFFMQVLMVETSATSKEALQESARVVKGKWWHTFFALLVFDTLAVLPGILVGFGLLTIGRTAVGFANGISSLLYALLIPLSVIAVTLLFLERRDAANEEPATVPSGAAVTAEAPVMAPGKA